MRFKKIMLQVKLAFIVAAMAFLHKPIHRKVNDDEYRISRRERTFINEESYQQMIDKHQRKKDQWDLLVESARDTPATPESVTKRNIPFRMDNRPVMTGIPKECDAQANVNISSTSDDELKTESGGLNAQPGLREKYHVIEGNNRMTPFDTPKKNKMDTENLNSHTGKDVLANDNAHVCLKPTANDDDVINEVVRNNTSQPQSRSIESPRVRMDSVRSPLLNRRRSGVSVSRESGKSRRPPKASESGPANHDQSDMTVTDLNLGDSTARTLRSDSDMLNSSLRLRRQKSVKFDDTDYRRENSVEISAEERKRMLKEYETKTGRKLPPIPGAPKTNRRVSLTVQLDEFKEQYGKSLDFVAVEMARHKLLVSQPPRINFGRSQTDIRKPSLIDVASVTPMVTKVDPMANTISPKTFENVPPPPSPTGADTGDDVDDNGSVVFDENEEELEMIWDDVRKCRYLRGHEPPSMILPEGGANLFVFGRDENDILDLTREGKNLEMIGL